MFDKFFNSQAAQSDYNDWVKKYKDKIKEELKKYNGTKMAIYGKSSSARQTYNDWTPWYIKTNEQYDAYVRNALELESSTPTDSTYYLRYMAARYKEHPVFKISKNSYNKYENFTLRNWYWTNQQTKIRQHVQTL